MRLHRVVVDGIEDLWLANGGNRDFRTTQIGRHGPTGRLVVSVFGGLTLTYGKFNCDIHVSGTLSNEKVSFAVVLPGTKNVRLFGKDAQPGDLLVVGEARENDARYRSELEYIVINVDRADVLRNAEAEDRMIPAGIRPRSTLPVASRAAGHAIGSTTESRRRLG